MPSMRAYLSLEASVASTMHSEWRKSAETLMEQMHPLVETGKFDEAHAAVDRMSMRGVVQKSRNRLEELGTSALLFGAHNAAGKLSETQYLKGEPIPHALQDACTQLAVMIEDNGGEFIRKALHELIRDEELAAKAELHKGDEVHVQKAATKTLSERLNDAVLGTGRAVIDVGANLTTSRLVTFGFLAEAQSRSITSYQISEELDDKTCPVCEYMHGKTFDVAQEYSRVLSALTTQDPKELRSTAPWPSQTRAGLASLNGMSNEELQANGYGSPPFHPLCRGSLVNVGTVEETIPLGRMELPSAPVYVPPTPEPELMPAILPSKPLHLLDLINDLRDQAAREKALLAWSDNDLDLVEKILREAKLLSN
ncbi:hypothetical protein [Hyphomicrobium sp.]|uniref:hypothetical protein n=1 Tax=Hyphomicrobium sp. TaxID=82 RepID=UPI001E1834C4|nr:hypothetical protein [Hyphomicrobium sp.]MBY0559997.1 hypothetical protein [Hyphomicrobium sp.]